MAALFQNEMLVALASQYFLRYKRNMLFPAPVLILLQVERPLQVMANLVLFCLDPAFCTSNLLVSRTN